MLSGELAARVEKAFARGSGHGLLQLGAGEVETILPPAFAYWREFGARYVTALCAIPEAGEGSAPIRVSELPEAELEQLALAAPLMTGAEYLSADSLAALWRAMNAALGAELKEAGVGVQDFLKRRHPAWNLVGRVHFNLAENRNDEQAPFAFLATYTTRLVANARAEHVPLGQALCDYAGAANRDRLLSLLMPVQRAAERCPWLKAMVDGGDIYHPLRWSPQDAFQFLRDVPLLEGAGVVVRMPASWRMNRPTRPQVKATVGGKPPSQLGLEALLDFRMEVTLEGETLSPAEIRQLLAQSDGLALIRGRWIEVDHVCLQRTLERFQAIEGATKTGGLPFGEAMRLLAGARVSSDASTEAAVADWSEVVAGPWLAETLEGLRRPEEAARVDPGKALRGYTAALSARRCAVAASARESAARRLPGRRYGLGQDDPDLVIAAGCQGRDPPAQAESFGGACFAVGQLDLGNRPVRAGSRGAGRPSVSAVGRGTQGFGARTAGGNRSGDHQLRIARTYGVAYGYLLAPGHPR